MWQSLGFKNNPYDSSPLRPVHDDIELLVGRDKEAISFSTELESSQQGFFAISGVPGVGKTSFLNIQQLKLESQLSTFGPHLLAARQLCQIYPKDKPRDVALRTVYSFVKSIEEYCTISSRPVPDQVKQIGKWVNSHHGGGFQIGLNILGCGGQFGRTIQLPNASEVSFEGFKDTIHCLVAEVVNNLQFDGAFIVLDNLENITEQEIKDLLICFRDTLFAIPSVWWILIGQSGLGSLIQASDPRIAERMTGSSLELHPITLEQLNEAIELRVRRFHSKKLGKSPLPRKIHQHLYDATNGEIRFVFKYCTSICTNFITDMRKAVLEMMPHEHKNDEFKKALDKLIGERLIDKQIPEPQAETYLQNLVKEAISGLNLTSKAKWILHQIGKTEGARPKNFSNYRCKSTSEFLQNFLGPFYRDHLLIREQEGKAVTYKLRGIALLASEFGILNKESYGS